ncbi:MAG: FtsL-like putative cell division protein [Bacteroidales bacterium]
MSQEKKNIEFIGVKEPSRGGKRSGVREFLDGTLLTRESVVRQLPFILFLTFLLVVYIGNRYHAERLVRQIDRLERVVKELRAEAISVASEYNRLNKPSEVFRLINEKGLGLKESMEPPVKLNSTERKK